MLTRGRPRRSPDRVDALTPSQRIGDKSMNMSLPGLPVLQASLVNSVAMPVSIQSRGGIVPLPRPKALSMVLRKTLHNESRSSAAFAKYFAAIRNYRGNPLESSLLFDKDGDLCVQYATFEWSTAFHGGITAKGSSMNTVGRLRAGAPAAAGCGRSCAAATLGRQ